MILNLQTTNYTILANHVTMTNARSAIEVNNTYKTLIASNVVRLTSNIDTVTNGISLNGSKQTNVNCNYIKGSNPTDTNAIGLATQVGIATSQSDFSTILCNTVDSTAYGFYFGSSCLGTTFRGNDMYKHLHSLYLNKVAVIDTQQHAGNRWNDLTNPFNAVNRNDANALALTQSLFITNPASGLAYNPTYPVNQATWPFVNDQGWFYNDTGATFTCEPQQGCVAQLTDTNEGSLELRQAIVYDSTLTSDYIPESKMIAKQSLLEAISQDTLSYANDTALQNFVQANEFNSLGLLNDVKTKLENVDEIEEADKQTIANIDSMYKWYGQNIEILNQQFLLNKDSIIEYQNLLDSIDKKIQRQNEIIFDAREL
ncbi:MAG: hypothetical protein IPO27_18520 [Bacteroidetes bacterium]|nr:hypothetical protein [Bacteroidota bacterium]